MNTRVQTKNPMFPFGTPAVNAKLQPQAQPEYVCAYCGKDVPKNILPQQFVCCHEVGHVEIKYEEVDLDTVLDGCWNQRQV